MRYWCRYSAAMDTENTQSFIALLAFQGAVIGIVAFTAAAFTHATPIAAGALFGALACTWIWWKIVSPGPSAGSSEWAVSPDSDLR
jgi:hypothetical protein